jgi:hypothetical protein
MRGGGLIIYYLKLYYVRKGEKNYEEDKQRFFTG